MKQLTNAFLLPDSNGYRVVDPNIIIQEVSGSSVSGDCNLLRSYNITPTQVVILYMLLVLKLVHICL